MMTIHYKPFQKGLTLIELMIAIAISSALMLGVTQIFSGGKRTYKLNNELARTQENIRFSVDEMARDIRMAGYTGCRTDSTTNTLNRGTNWVDNIGMPLLGFEGGTSTFPTEYSGSVIAGTDSIIILRGGDDTGVKFDQDGPAANFKVNTVNHGFNEDDILMLTDCTHTAVIQVTGSSPGINKTVTHQTGTGFPGNCTKGLGSKDCSSVNGTDYTWNKDAHVIKFKATAYYIAPSVNGLPDNRSLYRMSLDQTPKVAEELVEGVENMQITYGFDTDATPDGFANRYVTADQVTSADFNKVASVRIGLLFQSYDNAKRSINTDDFSLAGTTISAAATAGSLKYKEDHRLRFAVNTTIKLRNRGVK